MIMLTSPSILLVMNLIILGSLTLELRKSTVFKILIYKRLIRWDLASVDSISTSISLEMISSNQFYNSTSYSNIQERVVQSQFGSMIQEESLAQVFKENKGILFPTICKQGKYGLNCCSCAHNHRKEPALKMKPREEKNEQKTVSLMATLNSINPL